MFNHNVTFYITFHGEDARHIIKSPFRTLTKFLRNIFVVGSYWHEKLTLNAIYNKEIYNVSKVNNLNYIKKNISKQINTFIVVASDKNHKNISFINDISDDVLLLIKNGTYKFTFVGMSNDYLKEKLPKLYDHITIFNRLGRRDTLYEIAKSHYLVLPSIHEGTLRLFLEASQFSTIPLLSKTIKFKGFDSINYPFRFSPYNISELDNIFLNLKNHSHVNLQKYFESYNLDDVSNYYYKHYINDLYNV